MEKKKAKKKIRFGGILVLILFGYLLFSLVSYLAKMPIKQIEIKNNYYLTDDYIINLLDLNNKTATKISNQLEATLSLSQFQNITVAGDYAYLPLTPSGLDGTLYLVNWKNGAVTAGAKLKGQSGSFYIGSY